MLLKEISQKLAIRTAINCCICLILPKTYNMSGFLFSEIIFGPVRSRRLGVSLGINLLPTASKFCSFNCVYCECGWTDREQSASANLPSRLEIKTLLEKKLKELQKGGMKPDTLTFAGNGEPSIHPEFAGIVDDTILLRNKYFPEAATTVLSNSSMLHKAEIFEALKKVDKNILKLDSGTNEQFKRINLSNTKLTIEKLVDQLCEFKGDLIIQTLFLKGNYNGKLIDNTTDEEVNLWLSHLEKIKPRLVMIYPIDRSTPAKELEKISKGKLKEIAKRVNALGIKTEVY